MSLPLSPPVFRGKIPTTSGRLLAAAAVMLLLDFILMGGVGGKVFLAHVVHVAVLILVLLFSARRWVALLLLLAISVAWVALFWGSANKWGSHMLLPILIPLWVGLLIAYPRPRRRKVLVEEADADSPSH